MTAPAYRRDAGMMGRGSAGPRPSKRTLDPAEVLARQAHWRAQPPSSERTLQLKRCRVQLVNIALRSEKSQ